MRRYLLVPMLALALVVGACGSNSSKEPQTVTEIVTETGTSPAPTGSAGASGSAGITVVGPSGSNSSAGTSTSGGAKTTGATTSTTSTSGKSTKSGAAKTTPTTKKAPTTKKTSTTKKKKPKVAKVDPLHISCALLLDNNDIKDALGKHVSSASHRIVDVPNPDVKMTGKIKCYYGGKSKSKDRPVTVALAQYKSAKAAQDQMDVTAKSEIGLGADASKVTVSGHSARVLLRDGGLLVMRYADWTLSIAVQNNLVSKSKLPKGLHDLARMVLARVLKHG